jgi:hypothetical protein
MNGSNKNNLSLDIDRVNFSRIFNYCLGGFHNFQADRMTAERIESIYPPVRMAAFANRAFLKRCIRYLCEHNIHQFLDIGSGIQTNGGVHEFLARINPAGKIIFVDVDPVVVQHNNTILEQQKHVRTILDDGRNIESIISNKNVSTFLDFSQPVAIMLSNFLHYIDDDQTVLKIISGIKKNITEGSFLVIEHISLPDYLCRLITRTKNLTEPIGMQIKSRSHADIYKFFRGFEIVQPGFVYAPLWQPEGEFDALVDAPELSVTFAGVGKKSWKD